MSRIEARPVRIPHEMKRPSKEAAIERLRLARESAKLTQADAAALVGVVRTTLVAIEQGKRRVHMDELQKLATAYRTSANALLRREAVHLDMVPRFRKLQESSDDAVGRPPRLWAAS
jgi:transcriptional regulator with XRE-family HTH domain